jgi:hypothetical protein
MDHELEGLGRILINHLTRYPVMQVQDVYKLLHQAALGSEHAGLDETSAQKRLEKELAGMGEGPEEPLIDPISPDGQIARVHLRSCLGAGMDMQMILRAFLRTANEWHGSPETLRAYGRAAAQQAEMGKWGLRGVEIEAFFATMETQGYPAAHHSSVFAEMYHPAYRVVQRKFLEAR